MTIDAIIFDCDGTLVDSETLSSEVLSDLLAEHGIDYDPPTMLRHMRGREFAVVVDELHDRHPVFDTHDFIATYRVRSMEVFRRRLMPIEGAVELVQALKLPMSVASNGPRAKIETCLQATGLLPYFTDRIVSAFELNAWKPDPAIVLRAAELMNVPPERCLLVEDSAAGVRAGVAAGMQVTGFRIESPDPEWPADRVHLIDDLDVVRVMAQA